MAAIMEHSNSEQVIAVTIGVGGKHELLAELAARSCRERTGLPAYILDQERFLRRGGEHPHHLKFRLFEEFPRAETILYFDADLIFLKPFDITPYVNTPEFVCVRDVWDRNWIAEDAERVGIGPREYFNSGFFILNRTHHTQLLEKAESLVGKIISQYRDQSLLNAARARLNIPALYLSKNYNHLAFENCQNSAEVVIGHLNGIHSRPEETIRRYHEFWRRDLIADTERRRNACREVGGTMLRYTRVGCDSRPMEFKEDGTIGEGKGGWEQRWDISDLGEELILWIFDDQQPICGLIKNSQGIWHGQWMRYEEMPIELNPL